MVINRADAIPALVNADPSSPIKICPVLRLAVSRTASVNGRTTILISSTTHRNGFSIAGEPIGCRWDRNELKLYVLAISTRANQIGRARVRFIAI